MEEKKNNTHPRLAASSRKKRTPNLQREKKS